MLESFIHPYFSVALLDKPTVAPGDFLTVTRVFFAPPQLESTTVTTPQPMRNERAMGQLFGQMVSVVIRDARSVKL